MCWTRVRLSIIGMPLGHEDLLSTSTSSIGHGSPVMSRDAQGRRVAVRQEDLDRAFGRSPVRSCMRRSSAGFGLWRPAASAGGGARFLLKDRCPGADDLFGREGGGPRAPCAPPVSSSLSGMVRPDVRLAVATARPFSWAADGGGGQDDGRDDGGRSHADALVAMSCWMPMPRRPFGGAARACHQHLGQRDLLASGSDGHRPGM